MPSKLLSITKLGTLSLWRLFRKYYYWIILAIVILPIIISTVQTVVNTGNPFHPFIRLGLHLTNADQVVYEMVEALKEDPVAVIGMSKPSEGIWNNITYYWYLIKNVIWKLFGLVWMIAFPFIIIYKLVRTRQTSEPAKNFIKALLWGLLLVFVVNLIITIAGLIDGSIAYKFAEDASLEYKTFIVITNTLPFHGIFSLISYLIGLL